jgi:bacteriochlorophyll/chlorophyll synthetase
MAGAQSVAAYLENTAADALLAALPLSFDAGFSQLTTAFHAGARVALINYLMPQDVLRAIDRTGSLPKDTDGRVPGNWGLYIAVAWTVVSLAFAALLGPWGFGAAAAGLLLAWAYSAPPLRLKENGWWGNAACGISYEGIAWTTGAAVMAGGQMPDLRSLWLALLYSMGTHGIMTLNDFKAVAGDRAMGVRSLPVQLGEQRAAQSLAMRIGSQIDGVFR